MKTQKFILSIVLILSILYSVNLVSAQAQNIKQKDFYDSYLTLLDPYARKVIKKPYDLFDAKILSVKRVIKGRTLEEKKVNAGLFDFIVKVQYRTYTGAHDPPESLETLTFRIDSRKIKVIKRESKPI
ncbi:DUF3888 domain-containing protein [Priestia endophytica]